MPGIYEADTSSNSQAQSTAATTNNEADNAVSSTEETPARELSQTDRVNKFLLRSFLEHINTNPMNLEANDGEQPSSTDTNKDWE